MARWRCSPRRAAARSPSYGCRERRSHRWSKWRARPPWGARDRASRPDAAVIDWTTCGGSAVWAPDGRLLVEAGKDKRELVVADLDPGLLRRVRSTDTMLADVRPAPSLRTKHQVGQTG
ncbi:nitrilase-related carbon-nitrogen hydrolase [Streptantibioticus ferralitis]|uniref:CN hydrolase domain-containing protein n=1 Tax=Streptantibioticus ferralitis TaxID=236510 RepID=A0ABT5Z680_9ACTN|nr:nitrilase-related carbon-nitrogen hydrolase [Streptantibioticus ferralitis]MDF2259331.1 hypothetical protein [Streptantibioticus ferralitis]